MSYCRWSSMSFRCDLYCYESAHGYVTHVAGKRYVLDDTVQAPPLPKHGASKAEFAAWAKANNDFHRALDEAASVPIDHPAAGETFTDADAEGMYQRLLSLQKDGFIFPEHVLTTLREEITEAALAEKAAMTQNLSEEAEDGK